MKKPYLVDVPVLLFIFIRPDTLSRVFEVIKEARPSKLFIVSDGPRVNVPTDINQIKSSREIVEEIDWDCKVYKLYFETNQGMYKTGRRGLDFVFQHVDRCIFLEDDILPSISFFQYCADLLEKYENDLRVGRICGMNHLGVDTESTSDYFFSDVGSIWGFALWKRTYESFYDFSYVNDQYVMERIKENAKEDKYFRSAFEAYSKKEYFDGHVAGPEFFFTFINNLQNQLNVIPKKNMISNIGFSEGSTHSANSLKKMSKGTQQLFDMKTYNYDFPLREPKYVFADKKYEKRMKRILAWRNPIVSFYRRCEGILRRIFYGESKVMISKFLKKIRFKKTIEN